MTGLDRARSMLSLDHSLDGAFFAAADVLSNRFDSLRLVAARRDADFYLARERAARADSGLIALKVLPRSATGDPHRLGLFRLEARAAAKLEHKNIPKSSPPEEFNGIHYTRIEHQPKAESLKHLIEREGWLDVELAIEIIYQIADALEHAHARGVLHLRVQPENILIDPDGKVTLADFGIDSRMDLAVAHSDRASLCPVHYTSPEQVQGGTLDSRSDLYSLGVVFYQMLTDRLPVHSAEPDSVRSKHLTQTPLPPHLYSSRIPLALSEAVTRLLEKEPARRFQDVASLRLGLGKMVRPPVKASLPSDQPSVKEEEESPASHDTLTVARERWENPSIIRIEHPEVPVSTVESPSSAAQSIEPDVRLDDRVRPIERPSFHLMSEASQDSSLSPIVLVVVLAAAVLVGILVLAHFSSARNPSPPSLPNRSQAADPAQTLANVSTDGHEVRLANNLPAPEQPAAAGNASSLTNPAAAPSAAKTANSAVSARRTAPKRWMPARTSKAKRKSRRSPRYGSIYFSDKR